ncbi:MAG: hypothetical protein GQE15_36005 [Archangiaceae bacterium]|nr:hypothetical protein [Archangiaceae bacterium]
MNPARAVVVYRGQRVSKTKLASLIRRAVPTIGAIRHGGGDEQHFIVVVDERRPQVSKQQVAPVNAQLPADAPLSAVVQAAWSLARPTAQELLERAAGPDRYEPLARELSLITDTCWVLRRDTSRKTAGRRYDAGVESPIGAERLALLPLLELACSEDADPPVLVLNPRPTAVPFDERDFELALR